jgi:hypothetical protein
MVLCGRFQDRRGSLKGIEHDEAAVDGGEMEDDEEYLDSGVGRIDDSNILDAKALFGR